MGKLILELFNNSVGMAKEILIKANTAEARKYVDECLDLEKLLQKELAKPMDAQYDNVVESLQERILIVQKAAMAEQARQAAVK